MKQTALDEFVGKVRQCRKEKALLYDNKWCVRETALNYPDLFQRVKILKDPRFLAHCHNYMIDTGWYLDGVTWRHSDGRAYQGRLPIPLNSIAYCKEQDRQIKILRTEEYGSFQRVWRDNGEYRDEHCAGGFDRPVPYDVDCAVNGLGWYYRPGVWARMTEGQDRKEEAPGTGWKLSDEARKEIKRWKETFCGSEHRR